MQYARVTPIGLLLKRKKRLGLCDVNGHRIQIIKIKNIKKVQVIFILFKLNPLKLRIKDTIMNFGEFIHKQKTPKSTKMFFLFRSNVCLKQYTF